MTDVIDDLMRKMGLGATGDFPDGKIRDDDEGGLKLGVTCKDGNVVLAFGKSVAWLAMPPEQAVELGELIAARARAEIVCGKLGAIEAKAAAPGATRKTVCVDLDGVLATYDGWKGFDHYGTPRPGAREFMAELKRVAKVTVFTTRAKADFDDRPPGTTPESAAARVRAWLDENGIPYDDVYAGQGKPMAVAYVAVRSNPDSADFCRALDAVALLL